MSARSVKCFISYSHKDSSMCRKFITQLSNLSRLYEIVDFYDGKIPAGGKIDDEIKENLNNSDIIFLLISPDYLASYYCYEIELKCAIERHKQNKCIVVPVILREFVRGEYIFSNLKFVPTDGKPIERFKPQNIGFVDASTGIYNLIQKFIAGSEENNDKKENRDKSLSLKRKNNKQIKTTEQSNIIKYAIVKDGKISRVTLTQQLFDKLVKYYQNLPQFFICIDKLVEEHMRNFSTLISSAVSEATILAQGNNNIQSFLLQIFSYIQINFIGIDNTCAHIRIRKENQYTSIVNVGYPIIKLSTSPINAEGGMIECSKILGMPVIKSFNRTRHKATHPNETASRDYITFTFDELLKVYDVDISMCISVFGKNLACQKEKLVLLSIMRIDKIVEKLLMQYILKCTQLDSRYNIKRILN